MRLNHRRQSALLGGITLAAPLAVVGLWNGRANQAHLPQAQPSGRLTAQQILERAQPLCSLLAPQKENILLAADHGKTGTRDGEEQPLWVVDGKDPHGNVALYLIFDARTGELCSAAREVAARPLVPQPELTREEAIHHAWSWLQSLGIATDSTQWHLVGARSIRGRRWQIDWTDSTKTAFALVDTRSGELVMAGSRHLATKKVARTANCTLGDARLTLH